MSKLSDILNYIKTNKSYVGSVTKGEQFEDNIYTVFRRFGLTNFATNPDSQLVSFIKTIKPIAQSKTENNLVVNTSGFTDWFIPQVYGSQNVPDILCTFTDKTIPIELKLSKSGTVVWNGNFPRENCIYIVCSNNRKDITFFNGSDILSRERRLILVGFWSALRTSTTFDESEEDLYGFIPYLRETYTQNKRLNFMDNPDRSELERKCLEFAESIT